MDALTRMKEDLKRKREEIKECKASLGKKYLKRGDIEKQRIDDYRKKYPDKEAFLNNSISMHRNSQDEQNQMINSASDEKRALSRREVISRLRDRLEPILLFAETTEEAYKRLRKLEVLAPELNKGFKNDMQAAMEHVDEQYLEELLRSDEQKGIRGGVGGDLAARRKSSDVLVKDEGVTHDEILVTHLAPQEALPTFGRRNDPDGDCLLILKFLKLLLRKWGERLNNREGKEKTSFQGKLASATHSQTVNYIKPLFRNLKNNKIDKGILDNMIDIIRLMIQRNYLKANDSYLEMAIGNAPWPIGVTMVGIHARTGREKINDRNVAHVLNDETQRKYIQALKRLMTQAQKIYPTDPSRSVDFQPIIQ